MTPQHLGNKDLLNRRLTAFLASRTVQTARVLACYDWATSLSAETDCVVSGFQSPIERDVLHFLMKKRIPVVVVLARAMYKHIPEEFSEAYGDGRLLFVSVSQATRTSHAAAIARNHYVAELAKTIVFGMLTEESSLYALYQQYAEDTGKRVRIFDRQFGRLFERAGLDVRELLMGAHLPEDLFGRRDVLLSKEEYYRLMATAGRMAPEGAALRIATEEGIETFSPPIFAAYCSSNAEDFIARFAHYKRLVGPLRYLVMRHDGQVEIEIRGVEDDDRIADFWAEIELAFIVCLIRRATRVEVKPASVTMRHRCEDRALLEFLGCEVAEGERVLLTMREEDMLLPFVSRNDSMWQYIEPELRRRLSEMEVDDSTAARVRSALVELLPAGKTTVDDVASKLCMSRRTLQRKLTDEQTTFQQQLNATRLLLAKNYLKNSERTSDDIAFLLGYEDTTSFLRAFNMWTGMSITEYKKR